MKKDWIVKKVNFSKLKRWLKNCEKKLKNVEIFFEKFGKNRKKSEKIKKNQKKNQEKSGKIIGK